MAKPIRNSAAPAIKRGSVSWYAAWLRCQPLMKPLTLVKKNAPPMMLMGMGFLPPRMRNG